MKTVCLSKELEFQDLSKRKVVAKFNGGSISTEAGALLLREVESGTGMLKSFAECFIDYRKEERIEHKLEELLSQRIYGIALGYEDLNDHDSLMSDRLLAVLCNKEDPTGQQRRCEEDKGKALAGKSTLNRLELTPSEATEKSAYKKIVYDKEKIEKYFVEMYLKRAEKEPAKIMLDLDATDDPLFGNQEGKFYHGYYRCYCYLPLYIFCGDQLLSAKLRESNIDGSAGSIEEVERIVKEIRKAWPKVKIILRGDSGFCREDLMYWCEKNGVEYIFGLSKNPRLKKEIEQEEEAAKQKHTETGKAARLFKELTYKTLESWSRHRRVVAKAEYLSKGANPRFVVTSLTPEEIDAKTLYEKHYCGRGDMENRIKEQQLYLFADRTSTETMRANQLRLWFSSVAYILLNELRNVGLRSTEMSRAQCHTIRNKLLKIGAQVSISVRRVFVSFASGCPYQEIIQQAYKNLQKAYPLIC